MKSPLKVILGHSFCNLSQANKSSISSYNIAGLISEVSEEVATQIAKKLPSSTTPHSFEAPAKRNPREYPHIPYISRKSLAYIFVAACVGLSSFKFVQWAPKDASFLHHRAPECVLVVQGHPRSIILVPIESAYATSY